VKRTSYKKANDKLWKIFSTYIRLRDEDSNGYCRCIACGKAVKWNECDAGHYISRNILSTKYNEENVNSECKGCNGPMRGNLTRYALGLQDKYGEDVLRRLETERLKTVKFKVSQLEEMIEEYTGKVKEMMHIKGL